MANYANLKSDIAGVIRTNNNEEITGDILQEQLFNMVDELGAGYQYMGIAIPTTNPGSPDANVFYIASTAGTYTNFGGAVVADGEVAILKYNGSWTKEVSGAATAAQVTQLGQEVNGEIEWINGYMINASILQPQSNALYRYSKPIYLKTGTVLNITTTGGGVSLVTRSDAQGTLSNALCRSVVGTTQYTYTTLSAGYIVLCYKYAEEGASYTIDGVSVDDYVIEDSIKGQIASLEDSIGEVNDALNNANVKVDEIERRGDVLGTPIPSWTYGYLISAGLLKQAGAMYCYSAPISVKSGDRIHIKTGGGNFCLVAKSDSSGTLLSALYTSPQNASSTDLVDYYYTITEDEYIVLCYKYQLPGALYEINGLDDKIHELIDGEEPSGWVNGYLINASTMAKNQSSLYRYSEPIQVKTGDKISVRTGGANISLVTKSDSSGTRISALLATPVNADSNALADYSYEMTEDTYVIICYKYGISGATYSINGINAKIDYTNKRIDDLSAKRTLRVLVLGNSYAADAWTYVPIILQNYGINIDLTMYYRGGLALDQLYDEWESDSQTETVGGYLPGTYTRYLYYCNTADPSRGNRWYTLTRKSAEACVAEGGWDIISIQQQSAASIYADSYEPWASYIVDLIRQGLPTPYVLAFSEIFTRPTYDDIPASLSAQGAFNKKEPFNILLPYGTAVFNARNNATLAALGDSTYHNLWCSDNVHIQEGLPKYLAALTIIQALFDKYYPGLSVLGDTLRITDAMLTSWHMVELRDTCVGVTDANCLLAQKCAIQAVRFPWEICTII